MRGPDSAGPEQSKSVCAPCWPESRTLETDASRLNRGLRIVIHLREGLVHHLASASVNISLLPVCMNAAQDTLYHQLAKRTKPNA